jgi:hypothetical protein
MAWLIAILGAIADATVAAFATIGGLYATGYAGERGNTALMLIGAYALLVALSGVVCAILALHAASAGRAPKRVLLLAAIPVIGAGILVVFMSALEVIGVHLF